jgi:hypothetical protein
MNKAGPSGWRMRSQTGRNQIPDYLSAWTDEEGSYTLYLPRGRYYVGYATTFPPDKKYVIDRAVVVETDKADMDIVIKIPGL